MEGSAVTDSVPVVKVPKITSDVTIGPRHAELTASNGRGGGDGSEDTLKENWMRALYWTGYTHGRNPEADLWFARVVEKLQVDPYLESRELEIDQSPLGQFLWGARMNSLDLAILMGDLKMVLKIIERSSSVTENVIHGPIQDLSRNRKFLQLTPIFDADSKTGILYTPLHLAVEVGDSHIVDVLLKNGADVNAPNWQGETPLELVCKKENFSMLEQLLAWDGIEKKGPFHIAVRLGDVDLVKRLPFGDVNAVDHKKTTPLHLAVEGGHGDIMGVLLEKGANVNVPNGENQTPFDLACKKRNVEMLEHLLAKGDKIGRKPIHIAVQYGDVEFLKKLTSPDVNAVDDHRKTPLHYLATRSFSTIDALTSIMQYLAQDKKLDMKALDSNRLSAFYVAILCCNTQFVIALLDSFQDQIRLNEVCDEDLGPPIQIAFEGGDKFREIERVLMTCDRVRYYIERLYRDRQVYVDASNAILVGAALIASVTFASWLQPPLNYTSYFGEGYSSSDSTPSTSDVNYVDVEHNIALRAFWVFNALSFYFAIATVVCGAQSVIPKNHSFITKAVDKLHSNLWVISILLVFSVLFVIIAFAIAGTIVLTPLIKYQWCMIVPTIVGGIMCIVSLVFWIKNIVENNFTKSSNSEILDEKERDYLRVKGYVISKDCVDGKRVVV